MREATKLKEKYQIVEENQDDLDEEAWDDVSGAQLDPKEVKRARREEIEYVHKFRVYDQVPRAEAQRAGLKPIRVSHDEFFCKIVKFTQNKEIIFKVQNAKSIFAITRIRL